MSIDPYFLEAYARVNEVVEDGSATTFRYEGIEGSVIHSFIVRDIAHDLAPSGARDLISPYGYGGPSVLPVSEERRCSLVRAYMREFTEFCRDNKVVSEFIRFHPLCDFSNLLREWYRVDFMRNTVVTDLTGDSPISREFSKSARKRIRRNERSGISTRIIAAPDSLDEFERLYSATMDRNRAVEFYYFGPKYFELMLAELQQNLVLVEAHFEDSIIAAALCLVGGGNLHIHLSGTDTQFLSMSPAYNLRYAIASWALESGIERIHHGGGRTSQKDDALLLFKRQFGSQLADFTVGKRVWDGDVYDRLCIDARSGRSDSQFFPAYRARQ